MTPDAGRVGFEFFFATEQGPACPIERIVSAASIPELLGLDPMSNGFERLASETAWKASTSWVALGNMTEHTAA